MDDEMKEGLAIFGGCIIGVLIYIGIIFLIAYAIFTAFAWVIGPFIGW
jgi:hypothetical protein